MPQKEACNYMHCWRGLASSDASFRETHQKMTIFWLATFGLWFCGFWNFQTGDTSKQKWTKTKESEKKLRLRYFILRPKSGPRMIGSDWKQCYSPLTSPFCAFWSKIGTIFGYLRVSDYPNCKNKVTCPNFRRCGNKSSLIFYVLSTPPQIAKSSPNFRPEWRKKDHF